LGRRDNLLGGPCKDNVIVGSEQRLSGGDKNLEGGTDNDRISPTKPPPLHWAQQVTTA